jgi:hypothetical protein
MPAQLAQRVIGYAHPILFSQPEASPGHLTLRSANAMLCRSSSPFVKAIS